ncbi:hypothetical protein DFH06DRAFT_144889 [Mycena polygramma]|nr:hypothetical protein DFH06DRAFT_144889 [Mycena polygramma]
MDSTSLVSLFPQELIDAILAETASDIPTLCSCALVCHAFLPASQAQIFSNIRLAKESSSQLSEVSIQTLHDILVDAPHLRSYVRKLVAKFSPVEEGDDSHDQYYSCLVSILQLVPAVTSFHLIGDEDGGQWPDLPRELKMAIGGFCRRSDLATLWLWGLGTFTDLTEFVQLVSSPRLKNLHLHGIFLTAPETPWRNPIGLIELDLDLVHCPTQDIVMNWLIEGGSLVELRRVSLVCDTQTVDGVQRILNMSSNIENLTLRHADSLPITLSLAKLKKLCELQVRVYVIGIDAIESIRSLLTEPCGKSLEILRLHVYLLSAPLIIDWGPLADTLTVEAFPVLSHVEIWFYSGWQSANEDPVLRARADRFLTNARSGLHHLDERGILECKLQPW